MIKAHAPTVDGCPMCLLEIVEDCIEQLMKIDPPKDSPEGRLLERLSACTAEYKTSLLLEESETSG